MNCRHCGGDISEHDYDFGKIDECRECAKDVEKYVGHMIWDHKTAPALEIHANAKSLAALRDGRQRAGGNLVHEVKERSRRRESDISAGSSQSLSPYIRPKTMQMHGDGEELPEISIRSGTGKTIATYSRTVLERAASGDLKALSHLKEEKLRLAKAASRLKLSQASGLSITVWKDESGYYIVPKRSVVRSVLDDDTLRLLNFRTSNYSRY